MTELTVSMPFSQPTAVAVGGFDGVHLGHRAVIAHACSFAAEGLTPCIFTFSAASMPRKQGRETPHIYNEAQKRRLLTECGAAYLCSPSFDEICGMDGAAFAREILCGRLHARVVVCGTDFRFGHDAACDVAALTEYGAQYGFTVQTVSPVLHQDTVVSSSAIREALLAGEIPAANALLGARYTIYETVTTGNQIGRTLGFPTMNQHFAEGQCMPRRGVYASQTLLQGTWWASITNVGVRPTIGVGERPLAETYILNWDGTLYGDVVPVSLVRFVRSERQFDSLAALKLQLAEDVAAIQK